MVGPSSWTLRCQVSLPADQHGNALPSTYETNSYDNSAHIDSGEMIDDGLVVF